MKVSRDTQKFLKMVVAFAALFIILALPTFLHAEEKEVYLEIHAMSYHENRDIDYNEDNIGIGITVHDNGISYGGGTYENSLYERSYYLYAGRYTETAFGQFGIDAGIISGYQDRILPYAAPYWKKGIVKIRLIPVEEPVIGLSFELPIK